MVNVPGRSKGCLTCRQRKVKCDQTLPQCLQCLRVRLPCPGARTGPVFVHTVAPRPRKTKASQIVGHGFTHKLGDNGPIEALSINDLSPLDVTQPSRADLFDRLFVTHFIESFGNLKQSVPATSSTWLDELPLLVASPVPSPATHSIRAGSMLLYGTRVRDVSIQTEARRWYASALRGLRSGLASGIGSQTPYTSFNEGTVCAAVMLSHFETVAGTSLGAWFQHVDGASVMLEALGPERCSVGFMHSIFRHLRLLACVASIGRNRSHTFASEKWIRIPFENDHKNPFDLLVDILFVLSRCLMVAEKMTRSSGDDISSAAKLDILLASTMSQIASWSEMASWFNPRQNTADMSPGVSEDLSDSSTTPSRGVSFYDLPTAALSALYDTANMVILSLLSLSSSGKADDRCVLLHAESILSASHFINTNRGPESVRGSVMSLFPLKMVNLWSPSKQHRTRAAETISRLECSEQFNNIIPNGFFEDLATYIRWHKTER